MIFFFLFHINNFNWKHNSLYIISHYCHHQIIHRLYYLISCYYIIYLNRISKRQTRYLKFSAVLGAISAKSSILILPAGMLPMVTSKNTIGFLGFGGRTCHSTPPLPFPPPTEEAIQTWNLKPPQPNLALRSLHFTSLCTVHNTTTTLPACFLLVQLQIFTTGPVLSGLKLNPYLPFH